jgi:hypothetical protein
VSSSSSIVTKDGWHEWLKPSNYRVAEVRRLQNVAEVGAASKRTAADILLIDFRACPDGGGRSLGSAIRAPDQRHAGAQPESTNGLVAYALRRFRRFTASETLRR